eukprot:scaffold27576_cov75-Phaeocystis_antarctica.AAC.4
MGRALPFPLRLLSRFVCYLSASYLLSICYLSPSPTLGIFLIAADEAARSGDLRTTIEYASGARHAIQLWDEFRVWDPGD